MSQLEPVVLHTQIKPSSVYFLHHVLSHCCTPWVHLRKTFVRYAEVLPFPSPLLERWRGDESPASLKILPYSGFCNILHFQASEAQSIKAGGKVNQNSVPKYPLQQQHPRACVPQAHLLHSSPPRLEAGPSQSSTCLSPGPPAGQRLWVPQCDADC